MKTRLTREKRARYTLDEKLDIDPGQVLKQYSLDPHERARAIRSIIRGSWFSMDPTHPDIYILTSVVSFRSTISLSPAFATLELSPRNTIRPCGRDMANDSCPTVPPLNSWRPKMDLCVSFPSDDALKPLALLLRFLAQAIAKQTARNAANASGHASPMAIFALTLNPLDFDDWAAAADDVGVGAGVVKESAVYESDFHDGTAGLGVFNAATVEAGDLDVGLLDLDVGCQGACGSG